MINRPLASLDEIILKTKFITVKNFVYKNDQYGQLEISIFIYHFGGNLHIYSMLSLFSIINNRNLTNLLSKAILYCINYWSLLYIGYLLGPRRDLN